MALYTVSAGNVALAADLNQLVNLLNGTTTDTQVTVANRIRAQLTGATAASGYVGGNASGAPTSGTFATGDEVINQDGSIWVCTAGGTQGTWKKHGYLDATAGDIVALASAAAAGSSGFAADASHVHPWTFLAVLANANTFTALQTFSQGQSSTTGSFSGRLTTTSFTAPGGSSFPASPNTNDHFYRTDIQLEFYYDGTRWLSVELFPTTIAIQSATTVATSVFSAIPTIPSSGGSDIWLVDAVIDCLVVTTNNGSNYWQFDLQKTTLTNTQTEIVTITTTQSDTVNDWASHKTAVNALLSNGTTYYTLFLNVTKPLGSPGQLFYAGY